MNIVITIVVSTVITVVMNTLVCVAVAIQYTIITTDIGPQLESRPVQPHQVLVQYRS